LNALQVRHYRTDFTGTGNSKFDADWTFYQSLYANGGANNGPRALVIASNFSMSDLITRVADPGNIPLIEAIEGRTRRMWPIMDIQPRHDDRGLQYTGRSGNTVSYGTQDAQGDIWEGILELTTTFPVVAPSSGSTAFTPPSECSFYSNPFTFNFENMHSYTFPGQPDSYGLGKHMINADQAVTNCQTNSNSPLAIYATETGYNTAPQATSAAGVSELAQGSTLFVP